MTTSPTPTQAVLQEACLAAGLDATNADPIRIAENAIWRLPGGMVVRIARPGQSAAATREVQVARWLAAQGVPAVRALDLRQPVAASGHPVTFWQELPPHEIGTVTDDEYAEFCAAYGSDVTEWAGYELLAEAHELRMTSYAAQHAATHPQWRREAQYRVDCLRGRAGVRPWQWKGIM